MLELHSQLTVRGCGSIPDNQRLLAPSARGRRQSLPYLTTVYNPFHATLNTLEHSAAQYSKLFSALALSHVERMRAPRATALRTPLSDWQCWCCES